METTERNRYMLVYKSKPDTTMARYNFCDNLTLHSSTWSHRKAAANIYNKFYTTAYDRIPPDDANRVRCSGQLPRSPAPVSHTSQSLCYSQSNSQALHSSPRPSMMQTSHGLYVAGSQHSPTAQTTDNIHHTTTDHTVTQATFTSKVTLRLLQR